MKQMLHLTKTIPLISLLVLLLPAEPLNAQVTYRDTLLSWKHFDYQLDGDNGMAWYSTSSIVEEEYPGIVLENEYVRLVILPGFGARVISYLYKPTGHEQFYTNPVGTPYGMAAGNFYYDWLMVFGGVFPTFPEPEHGKTWLLPWQWSFTEISAERISLKMEILDTIDFPGHPWKFDYGMTRVRCISTVSLEQGMASFDLHHSLENTQDRDVLFEYWTCTTLAPGSEPGNTFTPANSEIIAPIEYVYLKNDWWGWMGSAEEAAPQFGDHVFTYSNLAWYENWEDMGIAYAYPDLKGGYYGVVNHTNNEGIFRISDNAGTTPGMKFWTWGAQQGLNADPENFYHNARPYIELWSGLSTQFFEDAHLGPHEAIGWTETYLPTVDMEEFSMVNANGALYLDVIGGEDERFVSSVFMGAPDNTFTFTLELLGENDISLYEGEFIAETDQSTRHTFYLEDYLIPDGTYTLEASVSGETGETVLAYAMPVTLPIPVSGIPQHAISMPGVVRHNARSYSLVFANPAPREITVYSINGQRVDQLHANGREAGFRVNTAGFYVVHVVEEGISYPVRIRCW